MSGLAELRAAPTCFELCFAFNWKDVVLLTFFSAFFLRNILSFKKEIKRRFRFVLKFLTVSFKIIFFVRKVL